MAGEDIELQNQFGFYRPRCSGVPAATTAAADSQRADTTMTPNPGATPTNPPATQSAGPAYSVQVAAVGTDAAAEGPLRQLRDAGYDPHVVREGGFVKIRVGRYPDRAQATAAASQIRARLGGSPFVVEER
jgi:cell division septation protein DedD